MFSKEILGIDASEQSIKFILGDTTKGKHIVKDMFMVDIPQNTENKEEYVIEKCAEIIKEKRWTGKKINFILKSKDLQIRGIKLPEIPLDELEIILNREVKKIYGDIKDKNLAYQILGKESVEDKSFYNIFFALIPNSSIEKYESAKFKIDNFDLSIFANERILREYINEKQNTMVMDIGFTNTVLMIFKGKNLEVFREINIAGDEITRTISNVLQIRYEDAELLKIKHGIISKEEALKLIDEGETRANQLNFAYQVVMDKLMRKISHSIDYFKTQNRGEGISRILICGGGTELRNIDLLLKDTVGDIEVHNIDIAEYYKGKEEENIKLLPKMIGAFGTTKLKNRFIKNTVKKETKAKTKGVEKNSLVKVMIGIAALIPLLIYFGYMQLTVSMLRAEAKKIMTESSKIQPFIDEFTKNETEINKIKADEVIFDEIINTNDTVSDFLYDLSDMTPDNIYFDALSYTQKSRVVGINGKGISKDGFPEIYINEYIRKLEEKYPNIHLGGTQRSEQNKDLALFSIEMKLKQNGGENKK